MYLGLYQSTNVDLLKHLAPDIVFNVLLYRFYYLVYMYTIVLVNVKRFRALCGFYAIENKLLLLLLLLLATGDYIK